MTQPTRREFLGRTAAGTAGLAGILATGTPPARGQQREISYLCWNNFAPAMDKKQLEIAQRFTKDTGIKIRIDGISHMGPQQQKLAAEVQTQAGHDLVELRMHFPWLYEPQLVDVSDVVAELEKKHGPSLSSAAEAAKVKESGGQCPCTTGCSSPRTAKTSSRKPGSSLRTPGRISIPSARS